MLERHHLRASRKLFHPSNNKATFIISIIMACVVIRSSGNIIKNCISNTPIFIRNRSFTSSRNSVDEASFSGSSAFISHCQRFSSAIQFNTASASFSTISSSSGELNPGDPSSYLLPKFEDVQTKLRKGQ